MIRYVLPTDTELRITDSVAVDLFHYRQSASNVLESGGTLLGSCYPDYLLIDSISIPGFGDKQGRSFFHRSKTRAQTLINHAFYKSDGRRIYIGEWHTHEEVTPTPSYTDRMELRLAFKRSKLHFDFLIAIIVGNSDRIEDSWVGYQDSNDLVECHRLPNVFEHITLVND